MNNPIKEKFIQKLYERGTYIRRVNDELYLTRCPYCGDSKKLDHGHFYLKIVDDETTPILYYCHKCPASGALNKETLELLGINDIGLEDGISTLNKNKKYYDKKQINTGEELILFSYELPEITQRTPKVKYIESRLGISLNRQDVRKIKMIDSLSEFLRINHLKLNAEDYILDIIERYYVGFLTFGSSHILFRDVSNTQKYRWLKYPITNESGKNRIFYSIGSSINILTKEDININLFEGVFDALSIYFNFEKEKENAINIAVAGKKYSFIIMYLISQGIFGKNVTVNIYADNDEAFNKKGENDTNIWYYRELFADHKYLFKSINVYYNTISKDCGVPKEEIALKRFKI